MDEDEDEDDGEGEELSRRFVAEEGAVTLHLSSVEFFWGETARVEKPLETPLDDTAPSARLELPKAWAAPPPPGAPSEQLGSWP